MPGCRVVMAEWAEWAGWGCNRQIDGAGGYCQVKLNRADLTPTCRVHNRTREPSILGVSPPSFH